MAYDGNGQHIFHGLRSFGSGVPDRRDDVLCCKPVTAGSWSLQEGSMDTSIKQEYCS
jgi:hypothetical protein